MDLLYLLYVKAYYRKDSGPVQLLFIEQKGKFIIRARLGTL